jgi:hypothetical protein
MTREEILKELKETKDLYYVKILKNRLKKLNKEIKDEKAIKTF